MFIYKYIYIYTHTIEYYSPIKRMKKCHLLTWMDLEIIMRSEVSQKEKDKYHKIPLICGTLNMTQMNLCMKQKQSHRHREQICVAKGKEIEGSVEWEAGVYRYKLLDIEWINDKVLLCSIGNYIQYPVISHNDKEYAYIHIYTYIYMYIHIYVYHFTVQ